MDVRLRLRPENGRGNLRGHGSQPGHSPRPYDVRVLRAVVADSHCRGRPRCSLLQRHHQVRDLRHARQPGAWKNTEAIGAYVAEVIRRLKDDVDGDLYT